MAPNWKDALNNASTFHLLLTRKIESMGPGSREIQTLDLPGLYRCIIPQDHGVLPTFWGSLLNLKIPKNPPLKHFCDCQREEMFKYFYDLQLNIFELLLKYSLVSTFLFSFYHCGSIKFGRASFGEVKVKSESVFEPHQFQELPHRYMVRYQGSR